MVSSSRGLGVVLLGAVLFALMLPVAGANASSRSAGPSRHATKLGLSSRSTIVKMGHYKHPKPPSFEHDQFGRNRLPVGPFHARSHSQQTVARRSSSVVTGTVGQRPRLPRSGPTIDLNTSQVAPYDGWVPKEPTTAAVGNTVVYTSNDLISFSVDGGHTFHSFDPRSMYRDSPAGGPDGDQDVIYVPQINRFVWLVQYFPGSSGSNIDRLAVFPPSAVTASGLSFWTYWDISPSMLPGTDIFFDFPDLAFGNRYLYLTQNPSHGGHPTQTFIARIGLSNLTNGLNLAAGPEAWRFVLGSTFFGKVVQNTGSVAYWASNSSTSTMAASYWPESSTSWFGPTNVNVASWPNSDYSSTTPDGKSWLNLYTGTVEGSARVGNDLYFAWTAARGSGQLSWLKQPHVELVEMTTSFAFVSQRAIWNASYAFAWPYLTSALSLKQVPQLGISLFGGGDTVYPDADVGDLTTSPNSLVIDASSNANCGCGRWGDYLAIRPYYASIGALPSSQFVASGYAYDTPATSPDYGYDDHYVAFTG
jgi:hypothetical protein